MLAEKILMEERNVVNTTCCEENGEEPAAVVMPKSVKSLVPPPKRSKRLQAKFSRSTSSHPPPTSALCQQKAAAAKPYPCDAPAPVILNIRNLPPEMLVEIFSFFNVHQLERTVSPVCKLWYDLSKSVCLRRKLSLEGVRNRDGTSLTATAAEQDTAAACKLLRSCPNLRYLSITDRDDADLLLRHVAMHNHELRRLSVKRCSGSTARPFLAAQVINKLLLRCPRLVDLTIKRTRCRSLKFFRDLGVLLQELRKININFSFAFGSDALRMIALHCRKLEEIRALKKRTPTSTVFQCCDQDVVLLSQHLRGSLSVLKIDGALLSDEAAIALAQCCHLRTLCVRHAHNITDDGVSELLRLRNLESLDLAGMGQVSPGGWARLFWRSRWSQMKRLSLAMCGTVNDDTVQQIARACPFLVKLNLAGCTQVTKEGLSSVFQSCRDLQNLNICLSHLYVFRSFVHIPSHTPHLKRLIYHPYGLEEENIALSFLGETLPELDIIKVDNPVDEILREL